MPLHRGYVDGPFGQVHYAEQGDGPAIVLVHMSGFSHVQYAKAMPLLADEGFRAVAIDLPGFGMSAPTESAASVPEYAAAMLAVVEALALEPATIVGSHLGAQVATEAAVARPDAVGKLVLIGPMPTLPEERESHQALIEAEKHATIEPDGSHLTEMWGLVLQYFKGWSEIDAIQRLVVSQLWAGDRNWYGHNAVFTYDHAATLARQSQPCLVLSNTGDVAHSFSLRTRDQFPQFAYRELEGGTALIVDEQPRAWTDAVVKFARDA
ncbi:MAG TPA: alpha/beta hydrolase [Baekduia sp.]|nr:alpha/beta hydrolase [Baekduia sp.]